MISRISSSNQSLINTDTVTYDVISTLETSIEQTNGQIALKADKTTTDTLGAAIADAQSAITVNANAISLKVSSTQVKEIIGYQVVITSSNGSSLGGGINDTVLSAKVFNGATDVTDTIAASRFVWVRKSTDTAGDTVWNASHSGMKSITVSRADVYLSAGFECNIMTV